MSLCQKWKAVIESNSAFWSFLSNSLPPALFERIMKRGPRYQNLAVEYLTNNIPSRDDPALFESVAKLSESWVHLRLWTVDPKEIQTIMSWPMPKLRSLFIDYDGPTTYISGGSQDVQPSRSIPLLDVLIVYDSVFSWTWFSINNLREISFHEVTGCPHFGEGLFNILCTSPRLELLRVSCCETLDFKPRYGPISVPLPLLSSLEFSHCPEALDLVQVIIWPASTTVTIRQPVDTVTVDHPWVAITLDRTAIICRDKVTIEVHSSGEEANGVGVRVGNLDLTLLAKGLSFFDRSSTLQFATDVLKPYAEHSGVKVRTLRLKWSVAFDFSPLLGVLDSFFPNITSLEMECRTSLLALANSAPFDAIASPYTPSDDEARWLFANVERLGLHGVHNTQALLPEGFMGMVRSRFTVKQGAPIHNKGESLAYLQSLRISEGMMDRADVVELQSLFGSVLELSDVRIKP
ncbi:hypothetical protein FRB90_009485 [Tulasnella sp. 427]|nr:hypothetical protein FRB90_009485 [Tulasnella sp. 427]